ncbi:ran-binding protein 3-like isoform X1, partial [Clarias magur]
RVMRGFPHAEWPGIMSLTVNCSAHARSPSDGARGSLISTVARCLQPDTAHAPPQDKPILAAPMFVFQKRTSSAKRTAEDDGTGACLNKRIRSITYPSLLGRNKKGSCGASKRARSSSLSFPQPLQVPRSNLFMPSHNLNQVSSSTPLAASPRGKAKNTPLSPASLLAPEPWSSHDVPRIRQVGLNADGNHLSRVTIGLPSSASALEQRVLPPMSRNFSQTNTAVTGSIQFVFGENMSERVLSPPCEDTSETDSDSDSSCTETTNTMTAQSTLWESAAAHTAACRRRCLLKEVQIFTGEENESNVVQLTCKLFVLERGTHSWTERGRGVLRLNDLQTKYKGCLQSRMVMRHQGSLKLILNTKLYPHTHLRRPARRNLQVTATDLETRSVRVFLVQASARDIARLYVAIHHRLVALRCSTAMFRDREGHCSEEDNDNEEGKPSEEAVLISHNRS